MISENFLRVSQDTIQTAAELRAPYFSEALRGPPFNLQRGGAVLSIASPHLIPEIIFTVTMLRNKK